jgi:hypothetical protein
MWLAAPALGSNLRNSHACNREEINDSMVANIDKDIENETSMRSHFNSILERIEKNNA